jgi:tetratricopeptide (TPR) repeat protein
MTIDDKTALAELISDLHWQIDQMGPRGIKNNAGNPYIPAYYKRGLQAAIDRGGASVPDYVKRYLSKPPSEGYRRLEDADSLDLACEWLVAEPAKPYAYLFSDGERETAQVRLAPHLAAIESRTAARLRRIADRRGELPDDIFALRALATHQGDPEEAIAINAEILDQFPDDVVALNRLGRAYGALGLVDDAKSTFGQVLKHDPTNQIASRRLHELSRATS